MITTTVLVLAAIAGLWLLVRGKAKAELAEPGAAEKAAQELSDAVEKPEEWYALKAQREAEALARTEAATEAQETAPALEAGILPDWFTAKGSELDRLAEGGFSKESGLYEAVIDASYEKAAQEALAIGGTVAWTSAKGYYAITAKEAEEMRMEEVLW